MPPIGSALQWDEPYDGADDRDDVDRQALRLLAGPEGGGG